MVMGLDQISQRNDDTMRELAREVGRRSVNQLESGLARGISELAAVTRWLLAALLALNGGAVLALTMAGDSLGGVLQEAVGYFILGCVAAVLAALAGAASLIAVSRPIGDAIAEWTQVAVSGEITEGALGAAKRVRSTGILWQGISGLIGLASLLLFLLGAANAFGEHGKSGTAAIPADQAALTAPAAAPAEPTLPPVRARPDAAAGRSETAKADRPSASTPAARPSATPPRATAPSPKPGATAAARPAGPSGSVEKAATPVVKPEPVSTSTAAGSSI